MGSLLELFNFVRMELVYVATCALVCSLPHPSEPQEKLWLVHTLVESLCRFRILFCCAALEIEVTGFQDGGSTRVPRGPRGFRVHFTLRVPHCLGSTQLFTSPFRSDVAQRDAWAQALARLPLDRVSNRHCQQPGSPRSAGIDLLRYSLWAHPQCANPDSRPYPW